MAIGSRRGWVWLVALSGIGLTSCSWILGEDLDGLKPFPGDAAADARSAADPDADERGDAVPDVRGTGLVVDAGASLPDVAIDGAGVDRTDAPERDTVAPDAAREGGEPIDGAIADHLDVAIVVDANPDVTDGRDEDAASDSRDAGGDVLGPAGDGGITGVGNWVIAGSGAGSRSQYEVHGWMKPTTVVRATTRSGLTIEGYLQ